MIKQLLLLLIVTAFALPVWAQEECNMGGAIKSITYKKTGAKEQIIFEFVSPAAAVRVEKVKPPFTMDPSGEKVTVKGRQFRKIHFMSSGWMCNIPLRLKGAGAKGAKITGFKNTELFEGYLTYVMGCSQTASISGPVTTTKGKRQYVTITVQ